MADSDEAWEVRHEAPDDWISIFVQAPMAHKFATCGTSGLDMLSMDGKTW